MRKQHVVRLSTEERTEIAALICVGSCSARMQMRARILLKTDAVPGGRRWTDAQVAEATDSSPRTVARVRADWVDGGMERALRRRPPRRTYARKLDGAGEARLIMLACSTPPVGQKRWTLRLLAKGLVDAEIVDGIAPNTVRAVLKKTTSNPG